MDSIWVSGTQDLGSIPSGATNFQVYGGLNDLISSSPEKIF